MTEQQLHATVSGEVCELVVSGDIDAGSSGRFTSAACDNLRDPRVQDLVINLAAVEFVDSSGLGSLVLALNTAEQLGKQLHVIEIPARVQTLLALTGLDAIFGANPAAASGRA